MAQRKKNQSFFQKIKRLVFKTIYYFFVLSIGGVVVFKFLPIPFTMTMIDRKFNSIAKGDDSEIHYKWRSYANTSREMHLAAVAAEDQNFPNHWGFEFKAMEKAHSNNMKGKKVRGASTISQQVAKNVFLWQGRSYFRKALEFYFTGLIELIWGKKRILEVYVNVAEMGKNTFGAQAAAERIFKKSAKDLNRAEAARLAAVLPSPNKWSAAKPGPYVTRRTATIQKYMRNLGGIKYLEGLRKF
jgi:monofunctional biosynthetic peptidoglycan transglycosylase